jgi:hypothetical protein
MVGLRVAAAVVISAALSAGSNVSRMDAQTAEGLRLRNGAAIPLRVEIRVGEDCDTARPIATRTLAPGRFWVIRSSQSFCLRREVAAGSVATWLPWERKLPVKGRIDEVIL